MLGEQLDRPPLHIAPDARLLADLGLDADDLHDVGVRMAQRWDVLLYPRDLPPACTVGQLAEFISGALTYAADSPQPVCAPC